MSTKIYLIIDEEIVNDEYVMTCTNACRLLSDDRNISFERIIFSSFDQIPSGEDGVKYLFIIPNNIEIVPAIIFAPLIRRKFDNAIISFIIPFNEKEYIQKLTRFDVDTVFIKPTSVSLMKQSISIIINEFMSNKITDIRELREVKKQKQSTLESTTKEYVDRFDPELLRKDINALLMKMYFGRHYKGFRYTKEAIILSIDALQNGHNIFVTKDIYPILARKYETTKQNIEHNIRTYIEKIFSDPNDFVISNFMLQFSMSARPSNGEFISIIADGFISGWAYKYINKENTYNAI